MSPLKPRSWGLRALGAEGSRFCSTNPEPAAPKEVQPAASESQEASSSALQAPESQPLAPEVSSEVVEAVASGGKEGGILQMILGDTSHYPNVVLMQDVLGGWQQMTGLPWWIAIPTLTFSFRCCLFPLAVYQQQVAARMQQATPHLVEVEKEFQIAVETYKDPGAKSRRDRKYKEIYAKYRCHPVWLFANVVAQAPVDTNPSTLTL